MEEKYPETARIKEVNGRHICGNCREPVSPNASTCPHCRAVLSNGNPEMLLPLFFGAVFAFATYKYVTGVFNGEESAILGTGKAIVTGTISYFLLKVVWKDIEENT